MADSQTLFTMEEENLFSMSVPRSLNTQNNKNNNNNKDKIIPQVLLSPILDCKNDIQENTTPEEWLFSLDETVAPSYTLERIQNNNSSSNFSLDDTIINNNNDGNCHNYYNMAQQNYQLWLASF